MLKLKQSCGEKIVLKDAQTGHHLMTITTMLANDEQLAIYKAPLICRVEYPAGKDGFIPTTYMPIPHSDWFKFGKILFRVTSRKRATVTYCFTQEEDEVLVLRADSIRRKEVDSNYYETFNDYALRA